MGFRVFLVCSTHALPRHIFLAEIVGEDWGGSVAEIVVEDHVHENRVLRRSYITDSDWVGKIVKICMVENHGYL